MEVGLAARVFSGGSRQLARRWDQPSYCWIGGLATLSRILVILWFLTSSSYVLQCPIMDSSHFSDVSIDFLTPSTASPPCMPATITTMLDYHSKSSFGCPSLSWTCTSCATVHYYYLSLPFRRPSLLRGKERRHPSRP
ncbi:hypothetical protein GALMADRAFT_1140625 [Galerina marginata CBS 339.88]|uniref:Uncharacterized protein n=1 Tax=Galerina marginata (strain CBS 339.88) TaxID=685588 RepID=A0A067SJ26_GALM3|nr:hypothetical protein GALMADRAFT_1140625 [Galerina marginata CBS 339.88]